MSDLARAASGDLARLRGELAAQLPLTSEFTPGSVHTEWRRCGKASCHCANEGDPGHGPRHTLVRRVAGKVTGVRVPTAMVGRVEDGVRDYRRFTEISAKLVEVNGELARRELTGRPPGGADRGPDGQKRGPGTSPAAAGPTPTGS
jgi:hypothetical protein